EAGEEVELMVVPGDQLSCRTEEPHLQPGPGRPVQPGNIEDCSTDTGELGSLRNYRLEGAPDVRPLVELPLQAAAAEIGRGEVRERELHLTALTLPECNTLPVCRDDCIRVVDLAHDVVERLRV